MSTLIDLYCLPSLLTGPFPLPQHHNRIVALRSAIASYLRARSADEQNPTLLPVAPGAATADLPSITPTLFLVKDALVQAAVHDLPEALGEQPALLHALRSGDVRAAEEMVQARAWGTPGKGEDLVGSASARAALVRAASLRQAEACRLVFLVEHLLAILYQHLRLGAAGAQRGAETVGSAALAALRPSNAAQSPGGGGGVTLDQLGSAKDFDQLRRLAEPAIAALEGLVAGAALPGDRSTIELLIRRTKECLMAV